MAKKFDPRLNRTLRVLTKFDTFDSPDAKATAVELIKEQMSSAFGAHALVCRSQGGDYDAEEESNVLSKAQVPEQRAGVNMLKDRLPRLYATLLRHSLPGLESSAKAKLREAKQSLETMGSEPINQNDMIMQYQSVLKRSLFKKQLTP
jgi:hypothetical protein